MDQGDFDRPLTRGECKAEQRPCPWISCRHHIFLDVNPTTGALKINFPGVEVEDMVNTCSLDVADNGEHTLEEVAKFIGVSRQRAEAIEHVAQQRARARRTGNEARAEWRVLLTRR